MDYIPGTIGLALGLILYFSRRSKHKPPESDQPLALYHDTLRRAPQWVAPAALGLPAAGFAGLSLSSVVSGLHEPCGFDLVRTEVLYQDMLALPEDSRPDTQQLRGLALSLLLCGRSAHDWQLGDDAPDPVARLAGLLSILPLLAQRAQHDKHFSAEESAAWQLLALQKAFECFSGYGDFYQAAARYFHSMAERQLQQARRRLSSAREHRSDAQTEDPGALQKHLKRCEKRQARWQRFQQSIDWSAVGADPVLQSLWPQQAFLRIEDFEIALAQEG